jgi:hypothetical protein
VPLRIRNAVFRVTSVIGEVVGSVSTLIGITHEKEEMLLKFPPKRKGR